MLSAAAGMAIPASAQTTDVRATDNLPKDLNVLFWSQDQRDAAFRTMETVPKVVVHMIKAGGPTYPLPQGKVEALSDACPTCGMPQIKVTAMVVSTARWSFSSLWEPK